MISPHRARLLEVYRNAMRAMRPWARREARRWAQPNRWRELAQNEACVVGNPVWDLPETDPAEFSRWQVHVSFGYAAAGLGFSSCDADFDESVERVRPYQEGPCVHSLALLALYIGGHPIGALQ